MAKLTRDILILALLFVPICSCCLNKTGAAPIPKAKKPINKRPAIGGPYTMYWHGTQYNAILLEGGDYFVEQVHEVGEVVDSYWTGKWTLTKDEISVEEKLVYRSTGPTDIVFTFKFTLVKDKLESTCKNFKLVPVR